MTDADLARRLQEGAEVIAAGARRRSAWSERIPASVHTVSSPGADSVLIVAGGQAAPHAITFEAPNARYWRHPVFGRGPRKRGPWNPKTKRYEPAGWTWVSQIPPRRFLLPAAIEDSDRAVRVLSTVVDDWAHHLGFTGS